MESMGVFMRAELAGEMAVEIPRAGKYLVVLLLIATSRGFHGSAGPESPIQGSIDGDCGV